VTFLLADRPVRRLEDHLARGGGVGLRWATAQGSAAVIDIVRASGLRGRGGAGFPTGIKWRGLATADAERKFLVCNAAEGEPGTYKDRWLIRHDPYQLLEGVAIAAMAVGAEAAFIGIKARFAEERAALEGAAVEMAAAEVLGEIPITLVTGPDDYLFGEEKGLLEVIEGKDPIPRLYPPYISGLFETPGGPAQPAVVNNVETLSNVPHILARGADWFRSFGTPESPGTMVFTVCGDVRREGVAEMEMGTPLYLLVHGVGEGVAEGRQIKLVVSGASNAPIPASGIDVPMSFEGLAAAGSGLGSGGFIVYDDTACVARIGAAYSAFLFRGSCGQCPPCKLGTEAITESFTRLARGGGSPGDLEDVAAWLIRVTDSNRCGLGAGERAFGEGLMRVFGDELIEHADGRPCGLDRRIVVPVLDRYEDGRFTYVEADPLAT
jgi:NADH:ubiquinone oxidoreductase subunit F (NADH-binding)